MNVQEGAHSVVEFVAALGAQEVRVAQDGSVDFKVGSFDAYAYAKPGGSRLRGSIFLDFMDSSQAAEKWIEKLTVPGSGVLECGEMEGRGHVLRLLFERSLIRSGAGTDPLLDDAVALSEAWRAGRTVDRALPSAGWEPPGDPRDVLPENAWLLMGSEASYRDTEDVEWLHLLGDGGVFEELWTVGKQTQEGDLVLVYFTTPRKAVHFVARAASRAFFDRDIQVAADGDVADEQWWAFLTPLIEIEPVSVQTLRDAAGGHLPLRGRSGHFLRPEVISALQLRPKEDRDQQALDRVVVTPTGLADLPDPGDVTFDEWRDIAAGPLRFEADVSRHIVEPLLKFALEGTDLRWDREYRAGGGSVDYVVLDGDDRPRSVVEVKLAIREPAERIWEQCRDLLQLRRYADSLGVGGVLIDVHRVLLMAPEGVAPFRTIERRATTSADLEVLRRHLAGEGATP